MASKGRDFLWYGERHSYIRGEMPAAEAHSWEYTSYPLLAATLTVNGGQRLEVLGEGSRWAADWICFSWVDDEDQTNWTWLPRSDVRKVTDSEWDIHVFNRMPPALQAHRWERCPPGFIPA
ncbi:hypothetical protein ACFVWT_04210 [Arthrobacter sp. NPDC058288]|uniref:hypothetical protein n=1 Tax=Arthrobacter sp. NPDC058288 TaxID=3346424 RepID=UPI0036EDF79A